MSPHRLTSHFIQKNAQGTAIFMALLIIAIVVTITSALLYKQQIDIHRTEMMVTSEQSFLYAQGVVAWAKGELIADMQNPTANPIWPRILPATPIAQGQGKIVGLLQDAQSLFNINNFITINPPTTPSNPTETNQPPNSSTSQTPPNTQNNGNSNTPTPNSQINKNPNGQATGNTNVVFANLIKLVGVPFSADQVNLLTNAITAWITANTTDNPNALNAFDQQYIQTASPYRSPHAPMVSISELRTVSGMTPVLYNRLLPYLIALPTNTQINSTRAPLLLQQAMGVAPNQTQTGSASPTQTPSQYFLLRADVYLFDQHFVLYSLLQRNTNPKNPQIPLVTLLWQSFGTL